MKLSNQVATFSATVTAVRTLDTTGNRSATIYSIVDILIVGNVLIYIDN